MSELGEERILIGETPPQYVAEHMARYRFALPYCKNKVVADFACGNGYGTKLLSSQASQVLGADIYQPSIDFCIKENGADNIKYWVMNFDLEVEDLPKADIYVCFETIEHLERPKIYIKEVLKKCDKMIFSLPMRCPWHFHKTDFNNLDDVRSIFPPEAKLELWSQKLFEGDEAIVQPAEDKYMYTVGVCSL